jgi:hypothetical protein
MRPVGPNAPVLSVPAAASEPVQAADPMRPVGPNAPVLSVPAAANGPVQVRAPGARSDRNVATGPGARKPSPPIAMPLWPL